jgi:hypothetical protein
MASVVPPIFKDPELQKQFDEEGYVKIFLLPGEDVNQLKSLFTHYFPDPSSDFYSSSYENSYPAKKKMSDEIGLIMHPNLEKVFVDYTWFGSAFLSKGNGPRSEMPMHQDWTIVDEQNYVAINIWTPLQDTNEENGTIEVIPGSHQWHTSLRAPTLPFYFEGYQHELKPKLVAIHAKANEAIVLNQSIIHYSKPNTTKDVRVAVTTGIKTKNAPMLFHYWNKEEPGKIELFEQEEDFLIRFENFHQSIFQRPVLGNSIGFKPFELPKVTKEEIMDRVGTRLKNTHSSKKGLKQKLFGWMKA